MIVGKEIYTLHVSKRVQRSLMYTATLFAAVALLVTFGVYSTSFTSRSQIYSAHASDSLAVWWPTDKARVSGIQPFKAMVENTAVDQYDMYWQVDGGSENPMQTSQDGYPHKEANVDVSSWNWRDSNVYTVTFIAKKNGTVISQHAVDINVTSLQSEGITLTMGQEIQAPTTSEEKKEPALFTSASQVLQQATPDVTPVQTTQSHSDPQPQSQTQSPAATNSDSKVQIWWPINAAQISGTQPFKAIVADTDIDQYDMYWQVDGGIPVLMETNSTDTPHKESSVNVTNWMWKGNGPYDIRFIARSRDGRVIGQKEITISTDTNKTVTKDTDTAAAVVSLSSVLVAVSGQDGGQKIVSANTTKNPLSGKTLYVDQNSRAKAQADEWSKNRTSDADAMRSLASAATAVWLGSWNSDVSHDVSSVMTKVGDTVPTFVVYNIPGRDCSGGYSSGGASSDDAYRSFINGIAGAIGNKKAIIVLEPDSLADLSCLSKDRQDARVSLLSSAVSILKKNSNTVVYLDAGHSGWTPTDTMTQNLKRAGVASADGFAVNVSNFDSMANSTKYADAISSGLGGTHYVIDTSRNGKGGDDGRWCNPDGRSIGQKPTTATGNALIDAYLWLKTPGESDGNCNGGPSAGQWWADYALKLVRNAGL